MIHSLKYWALLSVLLVSQLTSSVSAQDKDAGKQTVGKLSATLYMGTNEDLAKLGNKVKLVDKATEASFRVTKEMRFTNYCKLGSDTQPVLRGYENWLSPLKPAEEILISYKSKGFLPTGGLRLDLELWQQKRKVMKSDPVLKVGKPLLILGPKWRGGTLIISIELLSTKPQK